MITTVDFATFCYEKDAHRLHVPGQLRKQIESNNYCFNNIIIIYQGMDNIQDYVDAIFGRSINIEGRVYCKSFVNLDRMLKSCGIDIDKPQYISNTDRLHAWKYHVVNHLVAIDIASRSDLRTDFIVFADNDCWMIRQPENSSWIAKGIEILQNQPEIFIVSPNDGEPQRKTRRMSQQMFLARVDEFRNADFNQPNWDGNVNIPGGPMPEYWGMLEGRMELHCRVTGQFRYVLGPEYRYCHFNRLTENGYFETDLKKYNL